jgi:hypothetical protein
MPTGKLAGERCVQLDAAEGCKIFGQPERPAVCVSLQPSAEMCGNDREQAMLWLGRLQRLTDPNVPNTATAGPCPIHGQLG